ncbi:unknown [Brachyspira sp. CAG:484]|nr:unknown [Brachyspira sp. CAG:484]
MRINSINSSYMPARNLANRQNQNNNMTTPNIQFEGKKDHNGDKTLRKAGTLTTGALAASMLLGGMGSCDKLDVEHDFTIKVPVDTVEKYIPIIQDPDTVYQIQHDTIEVPVYIPGKDSIIYRDSIVHDTINQIITKHDTIWMKPEYDSPVAPIIKKFYQVLNINPGNGKIPVKMAWTDEKDGSFNKSVFSGKDSPINVMTYNITKTPFDEDAGGVVLGKNEEYYRLKFSKVNDRSLALTFEKPRIEGKPADGRDDQWKPVEYYIYDIRTNDVKRYTLKDDNSLEDRGEFLPGDMPSSIILSNPYGSKYRYSSLSVKSTDAPSKTEDYED